MLFLLPFLYPNRVFPRFGIVAEPTQKFGRIRLWLIVNKMLNPPLAVSLERRDTLFLACKRHQ